MKALIVDDEAHVIKAVRLLIPWNDLGIDTVFEAYTPQDAIRLLETECPEILITDIVMEELTGIDLMEYITNSTRRIKVIVISGYDNFEYVRGSLQNNCIDYLLKPLDQTQLINAVKKAISSWRQEDELFSRLQSHEEQIHTMTSLARENLLLKMLTENPWDKPYRELLRICPELGSNPPYGFGYCNLLPFQPDQESLIQFREALSDFLNQHQAGFLIPGTTWQEVRIFFFSPTANLLRCLKEHLEQLRERFPFPTAIGFAESSAFPGHLEQTLNQATAAYGFLDTQTHLPYLCLSRELPLSEISKTDDGKGDYSSHLLSALLTGNESVIDRAIDEWMKACLGCGPYPLYLVLACIETEHQMLRRWTEILKKRHESFVHQSSYRLPVYGDVCDSDRKFSPGKFRQRMHLDIYFLYQELKNIRSPEADTIYQVAHYIELNYQKPFSQFECAQLFFLNKEYLCRKFKQVFHVTMITYLNEFRIRQAQRLLEDPDMRIRQIAYDVGFEDEKYFSRQFKKITGLSPADYRTLHMKRTTHAS